MPKPTKLHSKGKPQALQKNSGDNDSSQGVDPAEAARKFELELCWCIQQLEKAIAAKQLSEKQLQETWKVLTILKNNSQPVIRKRQLMRTHFGDYRAKMAAEEKKLAKMASQIRIQEAPPNPKATFVRKSTFMTTGNSFKFNFDSNNATSSKCDDSTPNTSVNSSEKVETRKSVNSNSLNFKFTETDFKFNFNIED